MTYVAPGAPLKLSVVKVIKLVELITKPESQVKNLALFELNLGEWSNCFQQDNIPTEIPEIFGNL